MHGVCQNYILFKNKGLAFHDYGYPQGGAPRTARLTQAHGKIFLSSETLQYRLRYKGHYFGLIYEYN